MTTEKQQPRGAAGAAVSADAPPAAVDPVLIDVNLANTPAEYVRAWSKRVRGGEAGSLPVLAGLILIVVVFESQSTHFLSAANFANLLEQTSYFVLFGMAEIFVLLLGEIDLSVGYNAGCGAAITAILASPLHNFPWWLAALCGLAFTSLGGLLQGALITRLRIPSFVVTLGGLLFFQGALLFILTNYAGAQTGGTVEVTNSTLVGIDNGLLTPVEGWITMAALIVLYAGFAIFRDRRRRAAGLVTPPFAIEVVKVVGLAIVGVAVIAASNVNRGSLSPIRGVPIDVFLILGIVLVTTFVLSRTRFGRYTYAVGGNAEAARRAGVKVPRIRLLAFVLSGLMAGVGGLFYLSFGQSISQAVDGGNLVLYAVAAAVIGGTSLFGGRGKMVNAVLGGFVIAMIYNGLGLLSVGPAVQYMSTAAVLVAAATVDAATRRGNATA